MSADKKMESGTYDRTEMQRILVTEFSSTFIGHVKRYARICKGAAGVSEEFIERM